MTEVITRRHFIGLRPTDNDSAAYNEDLCAQTDPKALLNKLSETPMVKVEQFDNSTPGVIAVTIEPTALRDVNNIQILRALSANTVMFHTNSAMEQYLDAIKQIAGIDIKSKNLQEYMRNATTPALIIPTAIIMLSIPFIADHIFEAIYDKKQRAQYTRRAILLSSVVATLAAGSYMGAKWQLQITTARDLSKSVNAPSNMICEHKRIITILHIKGTKPGIDYFRRLLHAQNNK